jgi:hypothetical protein
MLVIAFASLASGSIAHAGAQSATIGIDDVTVILAPDNSGTAWGSMGFARNTPDSTQSIGCSLQGPPLMSGCFAVSPAGLSVKCTTSDPTFAFVVSGIASDSFVNFSWDKTGTCMTVALSTDSTRQPKK